MTVHARLALADDPVLGPTNLGVRVLDNVAVLWGPVPSEEVRRRAVERVKKVQGVLEVRDTDVYVAAPAPPLPAPTVIPPPPPPDAPTRTESDSPPDTSSGPPGSLTGHPDADPAPAATVLLGAPRAEPEKTPAHTVAAAPPDDLAAALTRVRLANPRFHGVEYRLEGDVVWLRLTPEGSADAMAFVRAIGRLPGLSRIEVRSDDR